MSKFKIGDVVKYVGPSIDDGGKEWLSTGDIITIIDIEFGTLYRCITENGHRISAREHNLTSIHTIGGRRMFKNTIKIKRNPNGDTRTAPQNVSLEQFREANEMHVRDVYRVMLVLSTVISSRGVSHDCTKFGYEQEFYEDFLSTINDGSDFTQGKWYRRHIGEERHHLLSNCPKDVNLIDVLEMIVDCTCAGLARSGEVRPLEITDDILKRAVDNTVELIKTWVEVEE